MSLCTQKSEETLINCSSHGSGKFRKDAFVWKLQKNIRCKNTMRKNCKNGAYIRKGVIGINGIMEKIRWINYKKEFSKSANRSNILVKKLKWSGCKRHGGHEKFIEAIVLTDVSLPWTSIAFNRRQI